MNLFYSEYFSIFIFVVMSLIIAGVVFGLSYLVSYHKPDPEKLRAFECGFSPFDDARGQFDVRFYVVAILFIIFDLEVTFLAPWSLVLRKIDTFGFWIIVYFLFLLTIGFIFEWKKGALEWS